MSKPSRIPGRGKVLAEFNESQTDRYLHRTKGWRNRSIRRDRAAFLVSLIKTSGYISTRLQARFLRDGYLGQLGSI